MLKFAIAFSMGLVLFFAMLNTLATSGPSHLEKMEAKKEHRKAVAHAARFKSGKVIINENEYEVKIADTSKLRSIGLQFAESATPGMLLLWDTPGDYSVWMEYTEIPLSAAFINADRQIIKIAELTPHSLDSVESDDLVIAILELPSGQFFKDNIDVGDYVEFEF